MPDLSQKIKTRFLTPSIKVWNHKLRYVISSGLLGGFGAILGIYIAVSYYIFDPYNPFSAVIVGLSTGATVFIGSIFLAIID